MKWGYKVTIWEHYVRKGRKGTTYAVRWMVEDQRKRKPFQSKSAANSFASVLRVALNDGEPFDIDSGLPKSYIEAHGESEKEKGTSWYRFTCDYLDFKWSKIGSKQRESIVTTLITVTLAVLKDQLADIEEARQALNWAYSERLKGIDLDSELEPVIKELEKTNVSVEDFTSQPAVIRKIRDVLEKKMSGKAASANYAKRRYSVFKNALDYAVECGIISENPMQGKKVAAFSGEQTVNPAVVPNHRQVKRLLKAVGEQGARGARMETFFAIMYYAGLRPEEVTVLKAHNIILPDSDKEIGEFQISRSESIGPRRFNDGNTRREKRSLKHRSENAIRVIPIHPNLVKRIRKYVAEYGYGADGRLLVGPQGAPLSPEARSELWRKARRTLKEDEIARGLAKVPYSLRHACVSAWLANGIDPQLVAEWAGHSLATLLRIYAKCLDGAQQRAKAKLVGSFGKD